MAKQAGTFMESRHEPRHWPGCARDGAADGVVVGAWVLARAV